MRQIPAMTFRGAVRILGRHDSSTLAKLDRLAGGAILAAGALSLTGAAPLLTAGAIWAWVDQKNEAIGLLRTLVGRVSDRRLGLVGYDRSQLIAAAHTVLVTSAVVESFREQVGADRTKKLDITEREMGTVITGRPGLATLDTLFESEVPLPSASRPFRQNLDVVSVWQANLARSLVEFCSGLSAWEGVRVDGDLLVSIARKRYASNYVRLAVEVPEFQVWAELTEHAATQALVQDIQNLLTGHGEALSRLEVLFAAIAAGLDRPRRDLVGIVHQVNQAVWNDPIAPHGSAEVAQLANIRFPLVRDIYVQPRYRYEQTTPQSRIADEQWWKTLPVFENIDVRLAAHFATPEATRLPLMLLGHPGAGKSMLTRIIAARLPVSTFTTVYVPLRRVAADAPIYTQVEQALTQATHGRVTWSALTDQTDDTLRVILLDGLDELLQASDRDRTGFLHEVEDFQRREAELGKPVAVVVTSRTVVADRVTIPKGTTVLKLEEFSEKQIAIWRDVWNSVNRDAITAGTVRPLSVDATHAELAAQPLLLLMLALYSADPAVTPIERDISQTALYGRLLENFTRREAAKDPTDDRDRLHELSVAAVGMFNRGRQYVTDIELGSDLAGLAGEEPTRPAVTGQHVIAQFFFVYTAQAVVTPEATQHSYEFLHATFGEYLVAREVVEVLRDTSESMITRRGQKNPDDDMLFALLSHDCLAVRRSILVFAADLLHDLPKAEIDRLESTLDALLRASHNRHGSDRYAAYRPTTPDRVREIAAYSANLVLLWLMITDHLSLADLVGSVHQARWRAMLDLWRAGLGTDSWYAMLSSLELLDEEIHFVDEHSDFTPLTAERMLAELAGDPELALTLHMGMSVRPADSDLLPDEARLNPSESDEELLRWIIPTLVFGLNVEDPMHPDRLFELLHDADRRDDDAGDLLAMVVKQRATRLPKATLEVLVRYLLEVDGDPYALVAAITAYPHLLFEIPELNDPDRYVGMQGTTLMLKAADELAPRKYTKLFHLVRAIEQRRHERSGKPDPLSTQVASLLDAYQWR